MPTRAMIVVGGGSSSRFGSDKLLSDVAGRPLISHTIEAVRPLVTRCVVVCNEDLLDLVSRTHPEVETIPGGATRTRSEIAGLEVVGEVADLIGIHDAARPLVPPMLVDRLFEVAASRGGAAPVVAQSDLIISKSTHEPVRGLLGVQTPQVFRAPDLLKAYAEAAEHGFEGHDTIDVMHRFSTTTIVSVPGSERNLKVTYPSDLDEVRRLATSASRT